MLEGLVTRGRAAAEARMLDEFVVGVYGEGWVWDSDAGEDVHPFEVLFTTKGRVKVIGAYGVDQEVGGRTATQVVREFHIPVDSPPVPARAVARCTQVHETSDPTLEGAELTLDGATPGSQTTARRLKVTEVTS